MHYSHLYWVVHAVYQGHLDVVKHVFHKLYQNILTQNLLFTLDAEKEEMKWQRSFMNSLNYLL